MALTQNREVINMFNIQELIDDTNFNNDDVINSHFDATNPRDCQLIIDVLNDEHKEIDTAAFEQALKEHNEKTTNISNEELKSVYLELKNRIKNPRGEFDSAGRFYAKDGELLDVRSPSVKYPYSQMNAARTAKFVKALAEKYKVQSLNELEIVAYA